MAHHQLPDAKNTAVFCAVTWQSTASARRVPLDTPCPTHHTRSHPPEGHKILQTLPSYALQGAARLAQLGCSEAQNSASKRPAGNTQEGHQTASPAAHRRPRGDGKRAGKTKGENTKKHEDEERKELKRRIKMFGGRKTVGKELKNTEEL